LREKKRKRGKRKNSKEGNRKKNERLAVRKSLAKKARAFEEQKGKGRTVKRTRVGRKKKPGIFFGEDRSEGKPDLHSAIAGKKKKEEGASEGDSKEGKKNQNLFSSGTFDKRSALQRSEVARAEKRKGKKRYPDAGGKLQSCRN